jgi:hypothetical protein
VANALGQCGGKHVPVLDLAAGTAKPLSPWRDGSRQLDVSQRLILMTARRGVCEPTKTAPNQHGNRTDARRRLFPRVHQSRKCRRSCHAHDSYPFSPTKRPHRATSCARVGMTYPVFNKEIWTHGEWACVLLQLASSHRTNCSCIER